MGPTGYPETSVRNYHYSLRNNREERSSQLLCGGSLKSLINFVSVAVSFSLKTHWFMLLLKYEGWNFNSDNYLFTTDTK